MNSQPVRWSADGQVCYIDGYGYGVTASGKSVRVGKEQDLIKDHPIESRWKALPTLSKRAKKKIKAINGQFKIKRIQNGGKELLV